MYGVCAILYELNNTPPSRNTTSDYYKNKEGDRVEETQWHNIVAWGKTAKIAADYLSKGKEIALSGKLTNRSYEDKEGNKRYITEIVANEIVMLEKKN